MKSFKKFSKLVLSTQKGREKDKDRDCKPAPIVGLAQDSHNMNRGMQELRDMASKYQGLVTVSSQLAASAYEFSGAVQNLGSYCVRHFGSSDNDNIGKIFETVGRVQFEISKSLDLYGSHVSQTIVIPTESLLGELRHLEDVERQYEAKRQALDEVRCNILKGKIRNTKEEDHMESLLRQAEKECEELAVFIGCRLLSLEHGRPRSLITQAARHYTAQVQLFHTVLDVLQGIEMYMKGVMQERNIDKRLYSTSNAVALVDNNVTLDSHRKEPARLGNLQAAATAAQSAGDSGNNGRNVTDYAGSYRAGALLENVKDKEGAERTVALWLQQDNVTPSAPTSPTKCKGDGTKHQAAPAIGPPSRRPPDVPLVEHVLDGPVPSSASASDVGDMPSDSYDESPALMAEGLRVPHEEGALVLSHKGEQGQEEEEEEDADGATSGSAVLHPPVVKVGVPVFSSPGNSVATRSDLSSTSRTWSAEAGASRMYRQAGPDAASSRRYSQSGPLSSSGTPWPAVSKGVSSAGVRASKDPTAFSAPARSPRVTKLQISELHKLPAPPRGPSTAGTPPTAPTAAGVGRGNPARSGPLFRSHEDSGPSRGKTSAQQQLLAAATQGRGPVSRSLSLPSSTQNVKKYTSPHSQEQPSVARKLSRPARKENLPSRAPM